MILRKQRHDGGVAPLVAVSLIALMGVLAYAIDGGLIQDYQRRVQTTADAAALAAAVELMTKSMATGNASFDGDGKAKQSALAYASSNGFPDDNGVTVKVEVNIPPTSGNGAGKAGYAEVIITYKYPRNFSRIYGSDDIPIQARAVARGTFTTGTSGGPGLTMLAPDGVDAIYFSGNGTITVVNASVVVNATGDPAYHQSGSGSIVANSFNITGAYKNSGGGFMYAPDGSDGDSLPDPGVINTGVQPTADPLAYLPTPAYDSSAPIQSASTLNLGNDTYNLLPGKYIGGINFGGNGIVNMAPGNYYIDGGLSHSGSGTLNMAPGLYYINDKGFKVSGSGTVNATEVMIYNGGETVPDQFLVSGDATINITPPTSGTYQGIAVFQDRASDKVVQISGNGNTQITGAVYAKNATVQLSGNGVVDVTRPPKLGGGFVAYKMQVSGDLSFSVDPGGNVLSRPPVRQFGLVE